ncbi:MAG: energy-coupling factor transporter transmembrane protein EcfT [Anaerolineae bacterium]|nr:energy-coupling factor transporter transmembrane protein EcfT [Anaerolineae bacterium]
MNVLAFVNLDTPVHRLSPLTKLFMLACLWTVSLVSFNLVVLAIVIAGCLATWALARIPLSGFEMVLAVLAGVSLLFILFNGFFYFHGVTPLFRLFKWTFTLEGLIFGIAVSVKVASVVAAIPILTMTTPISQLMAALAALRLPYKFIFAFGMAMRFVPLVQETYDDIRDAQRLRAHDVETMNLFDKVRKGYLPLVVPLFLTLLRKSQDMDVAIESRAFGAPVKRTYVETVGLQTLDVAFIVVTILFCGGLIAGLLLLGWGAGLGGIIQPLE